MPAELNFSKANGVCGKIPRNHEFRLVHFISLFYSYEYFCVDDNVSSNATDDQYFSLAEELGSELSPTDVTMSCPPTSMCQSLKSNGKSSQNIVIV